MERKNQVVINPSPGKVVEKLYDDLVSPVTKKVGQALGIIADTGNTVLTPLKFLNAKTKLYFENNLKKYQQRLDSIPEENVIHVPSEISIPILRRFEHITNEELSEVFIELLASASNSDTAYLAHPGFISIIDRICPDEAKLLKCIKSKPFIPVVFLRAFKKNSSEHKNFIERTGLEKEAELQFWMNIWAYLNNLESLGIIKRHNYFKTIDWPYQIIIDNIHADRENFKRHLTKEFNEPIWVKETYEITSYGRLFMHACIKDEEE